MKALRRWGHEHATEIALLCGLTALLACVLLNGCATVLDVTEQGRGALSKALGDTAVSWLEYDHAHQLELVNASHTTAEANQALGQYRDNQQQPIVKALHDVKAAMELLDAAIRAWKAGKAGDLAGLLAVAWQAAHELAHLLDVHGVKIPTASLLAGGN